MPENHPFAVFVPIIFALAAFLICFAIYRSKRSGYVRSMQLAKKRRFCFWRAIKTFFFSLF